MRRTLLPFLLLFLWGLVLCLGVAVYVLHGPRAAREAGMRLSSPEDGVNVSVKSVGLSFLPLPALRLEGLLVRVAPGHAQITRELFPEGLSLYADACEVRPDWLSLITGKPRISFLRLIRPSAVVGYQAQTQAAQPHPASQRPRTDASATPPPDFRELFADLEISVQEGHLEVRRGAILSLTGVSGDIRLPAFAPLPADSERRSRAELSLSVGELDWRGNADSPALSLRDLHVDLNQIWFKGANGSGADRKASQLALPGPAEEILTALAGANLRISLDVASFLPASARSSGPAQPCRLTCSARLGTNNRGPTLEGEITMVGDLPIKGHPTPSDIRVPFVLERAPVDPTASLSGALTSALNAAEGPVAADASRLAPTAEETRELPPPPFLRINGATFSLDGNAAVFNGRLLPGKTLAFLPAFRNAKEETTLEGRLDVERLSLPRWFGFARILPDGVRTALDRISGRLAFTLTPARLSVSRLEARLLGMNFSGTGGVADFKKPVIELNARTERAEVNAVLPELAGRESRGPVYIMPPAVDIDLDEPPLPDDVGYDILLGADFAEFWKLSGRGFMFRISPTREGNRLDFSLAAFYKGNLEASLILEKDAKVSVNMQDVDAEETITRIAGSPLAGGQLTARAGLRRQGGLGSSLADFAAKLEGMVDIQIKNGFHLAGEGASQQRRPFTSAVATFQGRGGLAAQAPTASTTSPIPADAPLHKMPATLPYTGAWRLDLATRDWQAGVRLDGTVDLSTRNWLPVKSENTPGRLSVTYGGLRAAATGRMSFSQPEGSASLNAASGDLRPVSGTSTLPAEFSGDIILAPDKAGPAANSTASLYPGQTLSGKLSFSAPALRPLLQQGLLSAETLGALPHDAFRRMTLACGFYFSDRETRLTGISGSLDTTNFSGSLSGAMEKRPRWTVDLNVDELDVNRYLPTSGHTKKNTKQASPAFGRFLEGLKGFDLAGLLRVRKLSLFHLAEDNLHAPLSLEKGVFTAAPVTSGFFGGKLNAELKAAVISMDGQATGQTGPQAGAQTGASGSQTGASVNVRYAINGANMLSVSKARKLDSLVAGQGAFEGDIHGLLRSPGDIPAALNGRWAFDIRDGSITSATAKADTKGTFFSMLRGSGRMVDGVLINNDLQLIGSGLNATGGGRIDLVNQTLDYSLNVSLVGVPNIPVRYHGSLDNPQREIGAAQAIAGALTNLGSGVFNLLEGAVTAPLRLLRP